MAGVKGKSGRHTSDIKREGYYFRLRPEVIARVERCTPLLEIQEGVRMSKAEALEHLLTMACADLERAREGHETPASVPAPISHISPLAHGTPASDDLPAFLDEDEETPAQPVPEASAKRSGRKSVLRQPIMALLREHPEGLTTEQIRVHLSPERPIGDTLQGMRRHRVVRTQGNGRKMRYFVA